MTSYTSKITVHYNNKLIHFIHTVKENICVDLNTDDFYILQRSQYEIFETFIEYQSLLSFNDVNEKLSQTSYSNNFALMLAYISNLDLCICWNDLLDQTKYSFRFHRFNFDDFTRNYRCCCKHECIPENQYLITNKISGLSLTVGKDCIRKSKLINDEDFKSLKLTRKENDSFVNYEYKKSPARKKKLLQQIINHWLEVIELRNSKLRRVIRYIYYTIKDKVDFPKVKNELGNISWYCFIKKHCKKIRWINYIMYLLSENSAVSITKKKKIQSILDIIA